MITIYKNTKVYVACPPYAHTGGPEALHTLAFELRNLGIDAYIYYAGVPLSSNLTAPAYRKYSLPYVCDIEEKCENVIIVPEIWGHLLRQYTNIQRVFYWLSVDNYMGRTPVDFTDNTITHLVQSHYAESFVKRRNAENVSYLSDYLNEYYLEDAIENYNGRKNIILYNPSKGMEFTSRIIAQAPQLEFVAISNMGQEQIKALCKTSKIYIDFGNHPGKDRLPRETAVLGNIILTNKKGAAAFYDDIPIKDKYKIDDSIGNIPEIIIMLEYLLENYTTCINDFAEYRDKIRNEKQQFIEDIKRTFLRV